MATRGSAVYVAGFFFGPTMPLGTTTLTNTARNGKSDVFVTRLTDAGLTAGFDWALGGGSPETETAYSLALSGTTVYLTGYAYAGAVCGGQTAPGTTSLENMLLASLTDAAPLAAAAPAALVGVVLYPNPAATSTSVQLPGVAGTDRATLTLLDAVGRVARTQATRLPTPGITCEPSVAGLAKGLYTLRIQAGATAAVRQLAVE